jgi:6-pyruvoyltetrahydropterin/6-carboxytetrahydropterin synthase
MIYELSQRFYFEAAHTLNRRIEAEGSRRIHGHTYHVEVTLRGPINGSESPDSGMLMDLGHFRQALEPVRQQLDHHFLDEVANLGRPTLENLCAYILRELQPHLPLIHKIAIERPASGDRCTLFTDA